ncbi:iron-containing alcohol dehydrogenase family protein [Ferviditalea candida]|uniref:Iron-containing alcohol dehydrogenase n=1 Tax=Ferviditalea candida TaxID=3108399 RepID=A0ABU5ZME9_9BACL|nr:iron-containing alcohol dehydrogenase [Paenibacillaceae bacterium T2]
MTSFQYLFLAQEVIFGPGSLGNLKNIVDRYGWKRLMICTTPSMLSRQEFAAFCENLSDRLAVVYGTVRPHVLEAQLSEALELAKKKGVDAVIGMGGGSPIGMAKAISHTLEQETQEIGRSSLPTDQPRVPVIAVPTTYAGSEMTPVYGVTRLQNGVIRKVTVKDAKVTPKVTLYDPELTLTLPPSITAGTGMNAVAHCIEALYSISKNPLSTAAAYHGLQLISRSLVRCVKAGDDLEARTEMMQGAFLAGGALSNVAMGLHHGICHVLGGTTGISHGDANSVMLPHVIRFNLDTAPHELAMAAEAIGVKRDGSSPEAAAIAAADQLEQWAQEMGMPRRLRELGVGNNQLPELAELAYKNQTVHNNPKKITDKEQLLELLELAW